MIDTEKLYLYYSNGYRIGKIQRINKKTVTMDSWTKIDKDEIGKKFFPLSNEEEHMYNSAMIRKICSEASKEIRELSGVLHNTKRIIESCKCLQVNTVELQKVIDNTTKFIDDHTRMLAFEIRGMKFELNKELYDEYLNKL